MSKDKIKILLIKNYVNHQIYNNWSDKLKLENRGVQIHYMFYQKVLEKRSLAVAFALISAHSIFVSLVVIAQLNKTTKILGWIWEGILSINRIEIMC